MILFSRITQPELKAHNWDACMGCNALLMSKVQGDLHMQHPCLHTKTHTLNNFSLHSCVPLFDILLTLFSRPSPSITCLNFLYNLHFFYSPVMYFQYNPCGDLSMFNTSNLTRDAPAGFNPMWEETLVFTVHMPELTLVRFLVWDHDPIGQDFIGQRTIAFNSMMPGKTYSSPYCGCVID